MDYFSNVVTYQVSEMNNLVLVEGKKKRLHISINVS